MALEDTFPGLAHESHRITSPRDPRYNCIAWAAGDTTRWWWPDPFGQSYWPADVQREETLEAFIQAYVKLGYLPCDNGTYEPGCEKIVIYTQGKPTHAARQLTSGQWTSKLGQSFDIEHQTCQGVEGMVYGRAAQYLRRLTNSTTI